MTRLSIIFFLFINSLSAHSDTITIAAASDLNYAMPELIATFESKNPNVALRVVYGSSGKLRTQIEYGAPFDIYFSANSDYPKYLMERGFASSNLKIYAKGRLVLVHENASGVKPKLEDITKLRNLAIANPRHAPYGQKAKQALVSLGIWDTMSDKIIYGESVSHAAQYLKTSHVESALLALSLVKGNGLNEGFEYVIVDPSLYTPLEQGFIVTQHAKDKPLAFQFSQFIDSKEAIAILEKYGFKTNGTVANIKIESLLK